MDEPTFCNPAWYSAYRLSKQATAPARSDPLVLDLDGDGVETVSVYAGTYFDHNGDGMAEASGWIGPDDGILVMDRNGDGIINDGKELFGNETVLEDGTKAGTGFQALAELDTNEDGRIDPSDEAFSQLRILKGFDGNGYELYTLEDVGIKSISLYSVTTGITDLDGNTQLSTGSFEWVDGTTGQIADYGFQIDRSDSVPVQWLEVAEEVAILPNIAGNGTMYDLHQAIVRDSMGQLQSLVEQFVSASDPTTRAGLLEQILFKWTDSELIDPGSRGNYVDARRLAVLEHWFGESWVGIRGPNPDLGASIHLNEAYRRILEEKYAELMAQTHLKELYDKLVHSWDEENQALQTDFTSVIPDIVAAVNHDPVQGKQLLSEFARSLRGISSCSPGCYLTFREHMLEIDPTMDWVFDTGGLPVYNQLGQGDGRYYPHMFGTWGSDAVKGSLTAGDGVINGLSGDDVIYGTARNELIYHSDGDALIVAGGGRDTIWAGAGNDILDGGEGSDTLRGETGNDTYIFRVGSGRDAIIETDTTAGNVDAASGRCRLRNPFQHVSRGKKSIPELPWHGARRSGSFTSPPWFQFSVRTTGARRGAFRGSQVRPKRSRAGRTMPTQSEGRSSLAKKTLPPISFNPCLSNRGSFGRVFADER